MSNPAHTLVFTAVLLALSACSERDPVAESTRASAPPDTSVMGAGPADGPQASRETTGIDNVDDGSIVARLKAGFAADPAISAMAIDVNSKGGMVTLSGVVTNSDAKVRADTLARSLRDVTSVNNQLEVKAG